MKKSKNKKMTILEASDFFDEHDIFELNNVKEVTANIDFKLHKKNM